MSYVLVQERDFDGGLAAADNTVALAPRDPAILDRYSVALKQSGLPEK